MRHLGGLVRQASPLVRVANHQVAMVHILPEFVPKHWSFLEHAHAYFEAHLLLNGEAEYRTGERQPLTAGSIFVLPPLTPHVWGTGENSCTDLVFTFTVDSPLPVHLPSRWPMHPEVLWQVAFLFHEVEDGRPGWEERVHSLLAALISRLLLVVEWPAPYEVKSEASAMPLEESTRFVACVEQFVLDNLNRPLTLNDIASALGVSRRTLSRHFRQATDYSVMDYLSRMRMKSAMGQLRDTDLRVTEIGERVGIPEPSSFCRSFRLATGITPQQYRQEARRSR